MEKNQDMNTSKNSILIRSLCGVVMGIALNCLSEDLAGRWYLGLDAGVALQQDVGSESRL